MIQHPPDFKRSLHSVLFVFAKKRAPGISEYWASAQEVAFETPVLMESCTKNLVYQPGKLKEAVE